MPLRLALLGIGKAEAVQSRYSYEHWYIGGHSLGGTSAAYYAKDHADALDGAVFCAAYPASELDDGLRAITVYGSNDRVLNLERFASSKHFLPPDAVEYVIEGGNHSQFGDYGLQKDDGEAAISPLAQQREAAEAIEAFIKAS